MKTNPHKKAILPLKVLCLLFGHDYLITRKVTDHISEYRCTHCNREVADNTSGNLEILTLKLKDLNSSLAQFFERKRQKMAHINAA